MRTTHPENIVDMLVMEHSKDNFLVQVKSLNLSAELAQKCVDADSSLTTDELQGKELLLTRDNEGELATEVLMARHQFTRLVAESTSLRQIAVPIIQNIYLTKERKIFFKGSYLSTEDERQEALLLLTQPVSNISVPFDKTFQHLIVARIWHRILYRIDYQSIDDHALSDLKRVVQRLNTLRNIYILLTTRLIGKITSRINTLYKQSIDVEDARQIANFGVARAAYRYHPSCGVRFSTFASRWVQREVQLQALNGRLIKIPSTLIEAISRNAREGSNRQLLENQENLAKATVTLHGEDSSIAQLSLSANNPADSNEDKQIAELLRGIVDSVLTKKSADIIKRKYGMAPYEGNPQSMIEIGKEYGVTRGSLYQLEKKALEKLRSHMVHREII